MDIEYVASYLQEIVDKKLEEKKSKNQESTEEKI